MGVSLSEKGEIINDLSLDYTKCQKYDILLTFKINQFTKEFIYGGDNL